MASFLLALLSLLGDAAASVGGGASAEAAPLVQKYCVSCHGEKNPKGGIDLVTALRPERLAGALQTWQTAIAQIESEDMPPKDPLPTAAERRALVEGIRRTIAGIDWKALRSAGDVPLPRLTREEYAFTLQDLIGIPIPLDDLVPEDAEGGTGFQTDRAALDVSDAALDRFHAAARRAAATAVSVIAAPRYRQRFETEDGRVMVYNADRGLEQYRGETVFVLDQKWLNKVQQVYQTFVAPAPGYYRIRARAAIARKGARGGLSFALDGAEKDAGVSILVEGSDWAEYDAYVFVDAGPHEIGIRYDHGRVPWLPGPPERPKRPLPADFRVADDAVEDTEALKRELAQAYRALTVQDLAPLGFRAADEATGARVAKLLEDLRKSTLGLYRNYRQTAVQHDHNVIWLWNPGRKSPEARLDRMLTELAEVTKVQRQQIRSLYTSRLGPQYLDARRRGHAYWAAKEAYDQRHDGLFGDVALDRIEVEGPVLPPGATDGDASLRAAVLARGAAADGAVRAWLRYFLPRAFRRPVSPAEVERYLRFHRSARAQERGPSGHQAAIARTLAAALASPHVVFRPEPITAGSTGLGADVLQARLAAFLWSSSPDALARDPLGDDDSIVRAVDRMVDDPRFERTAAAFTRQWLNLDRVGREVLPAADIYHEWSHHLAHDMRREVALAFGRIVREDRSVLELLDADWTMLNERLAAHYGIAGVRGEEFRPVTIDRRRAGGLLGMAAVLTANASAVRGSPVQRGVLVLQTLLGVTLPPPPPNVATLPDDAGNNVERTLRQELERHRRDPACAGCHKRIDPMGLPLESFDFVGRWRDRDSAGPIDARTVTAEGLAIDGFAGLKRHLREERPQAFVRSLTAALLTYAVGRKLGPQDEHTVRAIVQALGRDGYRARTLMRQIALSLPFRARDAQGPGTVALNGGQSR